MKVFLPALLAAMVVPSIPLARASRNANAQHVRGRQVDRGTNHRAPEEEDTENAARGIEIGRDAAACDQLQCTTDLHFCTAAIYELNNRCDAIQAFYNFVRPFTQGRVCAFSQPTILVQAHMEGCAGQVGGIKFDLYKDGINIRRYTEKQWPYTVFGDTTTPLPVAQSRVLGLGSYNMTVDIKDLNGCVMTHQEYFFDIVAC